MNEIEIQVDRGATNVYALIRNATGQVYQTTTRTFVTYSTGSLSTYVVYLTGYGDGFFQGNFPTAITAAGIYPVSLFAQSGGSPTEADTLGGLGVVNWSGVGEYLPPVGRDLASLTYVKQHMGIGVTTYDATLGAMITDVSAAIESYCNRVFSVQTYAEYYNPDRSMFRLFLAQKPVVALTQVTLRPTETNPEAVNGNQYGVNVNSGEIRLLPTATATNYFPAGFQTVLVNYQAGYATIPQDVQRVAALAVQRLFNAAGSDTTKMIEKLGDYNYQTRPDAFTVLTDDLKMTLNRYKRYTV